MDLSRWLGRAGSKQQMEKADGDKDKKDKEEKKEERKPSTVDLGITCRTMKTGVEVDENPDPLAVQVCRPDKKTAKVEPNTEMEEADWFHGLLPRSEIQELLAEEGAWLVRITEKAGATQPVISVKWKAAVKHIMLARTDRGWQMPSRTFVSIAELVFYHHRSGEPVNDAGVTLKGRPIPKRNWLVPSRDVQLLKKIGEGNFGEVFKGLLRVYKSAPGMPQTWIPAAMKTCKALQNRKDREEFMQEAKLMLQYQHPHVVRIYAVAADKPPLMLVMEMCSGGSLNGYLEKNSGRTRMGRKVRLCLDCAEGMEYLAMEKNCIHRDLAARNVLLGAKLEAKIADFGLTKQGSYQMEGRGGGAVPIRWTAPEAIVTGRFSKETDVWSFAVLCWEVLADGGQPWPGKSPPEAYKAAKSGQKMRTPDGTPPLLEALLHRCWDLNASARPNMAAIRRDLADIHKALPNQD